MQLIAAKLGMDSYSETISDMETKRCEAVWELFHAEVTYLTSRLLVLREVSLATLSFLSLETVFICKGFCP